MKNVLVLNGGSDVGVLVSRCINSSVLYHAVSAAGYSEHSRFAFKDFCDNLPYVQKPDFLEKLNEYIKEKDISFIIPTHETIALVLMELQDKINATIVCSPLETTRLCRYKSETYKVLKDFSFMPKWFPNTENVKDDDFPLFLKPDDGQGAVGVCKVNNAEEMERALADNPNLIACEYLPGEEFTVDCFTNYKGELIFINPRKRARIQYGQSARAISVENVEEFEEIANQINGKIRFRGYWFVQLKRDVNGELKLLEICTRFAGTSAHAMASGVNLPLLALTDFSGKETSIIKNKYKVMTDKILTDKYELDIEYDRVYVDYDDTITCEKGSKVNPYMLAYLYQCKNKGKEIVLLSRHTDTKDSSLSDDMDRLCIPKSLFSEILDIKADDNKSNYIEKGCSAIFIDNSFAERKEVFEKCDIPVFDVYHTDCLFDWRT